MLKKMLVFPNCKINLGLHVVNKRPDGFHNIETVFYPVNWCDALEIIEAPSAPGGFAFSQSGLGIAGPPEQNLVYKAWKLMSAQKKCPSIAVHLHKHIPMGAGLGGGSSDAAFFINTFNEMFELGFSPEEATAMARQLGSDCAFFIRNRPVYAWGKGDEFSPIAIDLSGYYILLVFPGIHSNTAEAYRGLKPREPGLRLNSWLSSTPVAEWRQGLVNDFETSVFETYPEIKNLKGELYKAGALYAGMSGSGSAVFGIFEQEPDIVFPKNHLHCLQKPQSGIL